MHIAIKYLRAVATHWGSIVTGGFLIGLLGIWQGTGNPVKTWVYWVIAILGLAVASFRAWYDEHKQVLELRAGAANQHKTMLSLEAEKEEKIPFLSLNVLDVLVVPDLAAADVFVEAEVSNLRLGIPSTITGYRLSLERSGKEYPAGVPLDDVDLYQVFNVYEVPEGNQLVKEYDNHRRLVDLAKEINHLHPVVYGVPRRGWLHFRIDFLPPWPFIHIETGGSHWEPGSNYVDGDDDPGEWVEETKAIANASSARSVVMTIEVSLGSSSTAAASINHSGKREIGRIPQKALDRG